MAMQNQPGTGPSSPTPRRVSRPASGHGEGGDDRGVGEAGERAGDLVEAPDAAEVAERGQEMQLGLQLAQPRHGRVMVEAGAGGGRPQQGHQRRIGIGGQQGVQPLGIAARQAGQIGRGGEHRRQRRPGGLQPIRPEALGDDLAGALGRLGVGHRSAGLDLVAEDHARLFARKSRQRSGRARKNQRHSEPRAHFADLAGAFRQFETAAMRLRHGGDQREAEARAGL
jgi:hypothetical protein